MRPLRAWPTVVLAGVAAVAGCISPSPDVPVSPAASASPGSTPAAVTPSVTTLEDLASLVVQPDDLAALEQGEYQQFEEGPLRMDEQPPPPRDDPDRFGRKGGWIARYRHVDPGHPGVAAVVSRVDMFTDATGAAAEFDAIEIEVAARIAAGEVTRLDPPSVGERAVAVTYQVGSGEGAATYLELQWVDGPFTASLIVVGDMAERAADAAAALAERIDERSAAPGG